MSIVMKILLTGGTGSFGKAFVSNMLKRDKDFEIVIFSRNEKNQLEMEKELDDSRLNFIIGDIQDKNSLSHYAEGADAVIHSAALKHIPTCEKNPAEAVKTNILGSMNVISASIENNIKKVVFMSTDKAVLPTSTYGATKTVAERLFIDKKFTAIRFGNLAGSSGSVIPLFQKQSLTQDYLTVTDDKMTRFFISLNDAVEFMIKCINEMQGGEIYIPKMKSIEIENLARAIAPDTPIVYTGLRPGEKLHESMFNEYEVPRIKEYSDHYIMSSKPLEDAQCEDIYSSDKALKMTVHEIKDFVDNL